MLLFNKATATKGFAHQQLFAHSLLLIRFTNFLNDRFAGTGRFLVIGWLYFITMTQVNRIPNKTRLILILGLLTAIGPFSIDMYLPAFPQIAKSLRTDVSQVTLSLSAFFVGISVGQMLYGPLLERYGRKKPMYAGLLLYLLASVGCALAASVEALILFRFLQALGGCAGMVAARAIVRDMFQAHEMAKVFSTLMLVVAVSPIIAPTLGGYLTASFGWHSVFVVLILLNIVILAGVFWLLPESKKPDPTFSLKAGAIIRNFSGIIRQASFSTFAFTSAIAYGGLTAYISGSPDVFMQLFGVSEKQYGWIFAINAVGIISASQFNNLALKKFTSEQIIKTALSVQLLAGAAFAVLTFFGLIGLYTSIALIFLFLGCQGFVFPNASALSLAQFAHNAGSASALMGAIQMGIGAGSSALVSMLQNGTAVPMSGVMAFCSLIALGVFLMGNKILRRRASLEEVEQEEVEMVSTL